MGRKWLARRTTPLHTAGRSRSYGVRRRSASSGLSCIDELFPDGGALPTYEPKAHSNPLPRRRPATAHLRGLDVFCWNTARRRNVERIIARGHHEQRGNDAGAKGRRRNDASCLSRLLLMVGFFMVPIQVDADYPLPERRESRLFEHGEVSSRSPPRKLASDRFPRSQSRCGGCGLPG